jgi:outer membrane protein
VKRIGRATAFACLLSLVSGAALAQGKVAVLNLEEAVFNTEEAKTQLNALRQTPDYTKNKKEAEELKKQYEQLAEQFNKNREVMSAEQEAEQTRKIKEVGQDLEFVVKKLQQSEREVAGRIMREMMPRANTVVMDLVKAEGIGLLINSQAALYAESSYNLSAKVTDKLNQTKP